MGIIVIICLLLIVFNVALVIDRQKLVFELKRQHMMSLHNIQVVLKTSQNIPTVMLTIDQEVERVLP